MRTLYFFWYHLNWLEFVTYVIIPSSIIIVILLYIFFNLKILRASMKISSEEKSILEDILLKDKLIEDILIKKLDESIEKLEYKKEKMK